MRDITKFRKPLILVLALLVNGWMTPGAHAALPPNVSSADPATAAIWHAVLDFGDLTISRPQLLAGFEAFVTNHPGSKYEQQATNSIAILKRMIAEDQAHAAAAPANLDLLPVEDRVRELIYQLRDQHGHQFSQPGACDIFNDERGTNSPAARLAGIGYPAVPQLIDALSDPAFTRSVGFGRNFFFSHTVLTVGDCAAAILNRIAGRTFHHRASTSGTLSNENKNAETRVAIEAWWAEFQKKGERQMLMEGTETGNQDAPTQAEYLIARHPDVALASVIKGAQAASEDWTRTRMVQLVERCDSPEALAFLEQEMRRGASAPSVAAAAILTRKGRPEALQAMILEWGKAAKTGPDDVHGPSELVSFLASVDSPEAIQALGRDIQAHSLNTRMAVVRTVGEGGSWYYGYPEKTNRSKATQAACEKLLATALQDDGQVMGESGSIMGKNYINPRVCDMAGFHLNQGWPDRYTFDLSASLKVRDQQRIDCENTWRRSQNLPLLPQPSPTATRVPAAESAKVTTIVWKPDSVKPSAPFASKIKAMDGGILDAEKVVDLFMNYASTPESETSGLVFEARKDEDLTGVRLTVGLIPGTAQNPKDDWQFAQGATVGDKAVDCRAGGIWATEKRSWEDLVRTIKTAVAASPETPFVINVRLVSKAH